jgi:hypothetical protein
MQTLLRLSTRSYVPQVREFVNSQVFSAERASCFSCIERRPSLHRCDALGRRGPLGNGRRDQEVYLARWSWSSCIVVTPTAPCTAAAANSHSHPEIGGFLIKPYEPSKSVIGSGEGCEDQTLPSSYGPTLTFKILARSCDCYDIAVGFRKLNL